MKNIVVQSESLEWLKSQESNSFDAFILDPPYNVSYKYNTFKDNKPQQDYIDEQLEILKECNRCLKDSGSILYLNYPENAADIWARVDFMNRFDWINWVYNVHASGKPIRKASRAWLWLTKTENPKIINEAFKGEYKNPTDKRVAGMIAQGKSPQMYDWIQMEQVKNVSKEKRDHPCQLPERMVEMLIKGVTDKDDLVGDCYSGSGTTAICATRLERSFAGCDMDLKYVNEANKYIQIELDKLS